MKTGADDWKADCAAPRRDVCALEHPPGTEVFSFLDHRLHLVTGGHGPVLLLIHGFPTSSHDWHAIWPDLATRHALCALDMLGFGLSDKPADFDYTVAQELLARQRDRRLSFRIRAATFLNRGLFPEATRPLLVQRLLLGAAGPLVARLASFRSFAASMRRICVRPPDEAELREHWRRLHHGNGRRVMPRLIRYIRERKTHRERWLGALQQAEIPLALIDGVADPISGASIVRRWRELLPASLVCELAGVGHYPQLEAPERVLAAFRGMPSQH